MGRPEFNPLRDVMSGVIMAATSVPQLIAYAETVGYAGYRGLQTAGVPLAAWGIATGSPFISCGVTSITALMAKVDLDGEAYVAEFGEEAYVKLVAAYSLWVGLASCLLAVVGFSKLAQSTPKAVSKGFKWGCAFGVLLSAFPNGLYLHGGGELKKLAASNALVAAVTQYKNVAPGAAGFSSLVYAITHFWEWGLEPAIIFFVGTAVIMQSKQILPSFLQNGGEVILVTALASIYSAYFGYTGAIVGEIPDVDPDAGFSFLGGAIRIPVEFLDVKALITEVPLVSRFGGSYLKLAITATLFAAVNFLSIMGIASGFETENNIAWSAERECIAQGVACAAAAAVGSAPVSGSMSRSLVSRMIGTTSQLSSVVTALCWIYLLPYMKVMSPTPKAALSAVINSAVVKSVLVPKDLMNLQGIDFIVGWGTGIATLLTSPTQGFGIGLALFAATRPFVGKDKEKTQ